MRESTLGLTRWSLSYACDQDKMFDTLYNTQRAFCMPEPVYKTHHNIVHFCHFLSLFQSFTMVYVV